MAEPRFIVAPLSSTPVTITRARALIAHWMVEEQGSGYPSITVSKVESRGPGRCSCGCLRVENFLDCPCETRRPTS